MNHTNDFATAVRGLIRAGGYDIETRRLQARVLIDAHIAKTGAVPPFEDVELLNDYITFGG